MTFAFGSGPDHLPSTFHFGMGGFGVRGDAVPSEGEHGASPLYACVTLPADAAKEFRLRVTRLPSSGTLVLREDGTMDYTGTPVPWSDSFDAQLQVDGIDLGGTITFPLTIGGGAGASVGGSATEGSDAAAGGAVSVDEATLILKILTNRQELSAATGKYTLYDDDAITILYQANAWEDVAGTIPYRGHGCGRIDALL